MLAWDAKIQRGGGNEYSYTRLHVREAGGDRPIVFTAYSAGTPPTLTVRLTREAAWVLWEELQRLLGGDPEELTDPDFIDTDLEAQ